MSDHELDWVPVGEEPAASEVPAWEGAAYDPHGVRVRVAEVPQYPSQTVYGFFKVWQAEQRTTKHGKKFLTLQLADDGGVVSAKLWDRVEGVAEKCAAGTVVKAKGKVEQYQGAWEICLEEIRPVEARDRSQFDGENMDPPGKYTADEITAMDGELRGIVAHFSNEHLRGLVLAFLDDPEIGSRFRKAPAAKVLHHAWLGGLLEHVLTLVKLLLAMTPFYPEVDRDLVVTGAILHDIGKVRELDWKAGYSYTLEGQLIGHISIAQRMLGDKVRDLPGFPEKLRVLVEHMILSHHGKLEFGSPKLPMTPEAMLLSAVDDLEAKFAAIAAGVWGRGAGGQGGRGDDGLGAEYGAEFI